MRKILEKLPGSVPAKIAVTLAHQDRQKSRGLLRLDDGTEAALLLNRGMTLQHGDRLLGDDGVVVLVQAALEGLSIVTSDDPLSLGRAAYHLGNRHIPVQIEALRLAYLHDHVLDDMLRSLGFGIGFSAEQFEPEAGAYGHGHAHAAPSRSTVPPPRVHAQENHGHGHALQHEHDSEHEPSMSKKSLDAVS